MAAIGRRTFVSLLSRLTVVRSARADDSADIHSLIGEIAEALSSGEPEQAMECFSAKYPKQKALRDSFDALTGAYYVESQIAFLDEEDSPTATKMTVRWDLALTTLQSGFTKNRSAEIDVKVAREGKRWKVLEFAPISIFDPTSD